MQTYRFYRLDLNGRVFSAEDCEAPDDPAALEAARAFCGQTEVEVWQEARRIGLLKRSGELSP